jgi:hypothetical protein
MLSIRFLWEIHDMKWRFMTAGDIAGIVALDGSSSKTRGRR